MVDEPASDASAAPDPCLDLDLCPDPVDEAGDAGTALGADAAATSRDAGVRLDAGARADAGPSKPGFVVGAKLLVKTYAAFRKLPDSSAALITDIEPHGGVNEPNHGTSTAGAITPAQLVTLASDVPSNGHYKVTFDGKTGWVGASKLAALDSTVGKVEYALRTANRNAFFKHQLYRTLWNRDGRTDSSGNCAPTSLAMAVRILGKEPAFLSVEQSVHLIRSKYENPIQEQSGTTAAEIHRAAQAMGVTPTRMYDKSSASDGMAAINAHLAAGRMIVLEGRPGDPNQPRNSTGHTGATTAYEKALTRYYTSYTGSTPLRYSRYDFDGRHSILVLGREASGNYVVGDPFCEVGFVSLTAAAMKDFIVRDAGHYGSGNAVK